jgi:Dolichyl-phosphate-mannose-protein mannosyltransferase
MTTRNAVPSDRPVSRSRAPRLGLSLVLLFGGTLGYFLWNTFWDPVPHLYAPRLQPADWISPPEDTPQGYYRKEVYVGQPVREAWIALSATDAYQLYVNGDAVGHGTFVSANVSGVYDVSREIATGKNVIAVSIHRQSFPGPSRLALRLVLRDYQGRETVVVSDRTWKTAPVEDRQIEGSLLWYDLDFNATPWSFANDSGPARPDEIYPVSFDPESLAAAPRGRWILHPDPGSRSSYFEKTVSLPSRAREAWIRISAPEHYDLMLNGFKIADTDGSDTRMDVYDIGPLLRPGPNRISIGATSRRGPARILADGEIRPRDGGTRALRTDASWEASRPGDATAAAAFTDFSLPVHAFTKTLQTILRPTDLAWRAYGRLVQAMAIGLLLSVGAWTAYGLFRVRRFREDRAEALRSAASLYLPSLVFLGGLLLLRFDIRHDPSFPFQTRFIAVAAALVLVFASFDLIERFWRERTGRKRTDPNPQAGTEPAQGDSRRASRGWTLVLVCLLLAGLGLRLHGLNEVSLTHDEVGMVQYAQDLKQEGYPSKRIGSLDKPLTTYELIPYPILASVTIFGWSDWAVRLPAVLFGGMTILLIFATGRELFNRWAGALAAAVYAFSPWAIIWSQNLFYPQQAQLASLLTVYFFFKAIRRETIVPRYLYLAAASFMFNYLSWEGTGFLLPALGVGLVAYKGNDFRWLKSGAVWRAVGGVALAIFIQYCLRILTQAPFLAVGTGPGDIKFDPFFFLNAMYDPYFYLQHFFWLEGQEVLTLVFIAGAFLIVRDRNLRFLYAVLLAVVFAMTNFLPVYAQRYLYFAQPFLILCSAAVCVTMLRGLFERGSPEPVPVGSAGVSFSTAAARAIVAVLFPILIFSSAHSRFLQLYRFSQNTGEPPPQTRLGVYYVDYRSADRYVGRSFRDGDAVVAVMTHMYAYYAGKRSDYNFNSTLASRSYYDPETKPPKFLDRYMGNPVMRDFDEARNALLAHPRVWIIAAPSDGFVSQNERDLIRYLLDHSRVMYESYKAKVYLWKG